MDGEFVRLANYEIFIRQLDAAVQSSPAFKNFTEVEKNKLSELISTAFETTLSQPEFSELDILDMFAKMAVLTAANNPVAAKINSFFHNFMQNLAKLHAEHTAFFHKMGESALALMKENPGAIKQLAPYYSDIFKAKIP